MGRVGSLLVVGEGELFSVFGFAGLLDQFAVAVTEAAKFVIVSEMDRDLAVEVDAGDFGFGLG